MSVADSSQLRAEFSDQNGVSLKMSSKQALKQVRCSRFQACSGVIFLLITLVAAILITYIITKDSMERRRLYEGQYSAVSGVIGSKYMDNNYDSEYKLM